MLKYFYRLHDGSKTEVDELDYNNICGRINTGRYNGFYLHRGIINPDKKFAFKYFMCIETEGTPPPKDQIVRKIDIDKRKPGEVGKPKEIIKGCPHDWNKPETWQYIQTNVNGRIQYRKECLTCKKVSSLVKPKEVKNAMEQDGKTIADVIDRTKK